METHADSICLVCTTPYFLSHFEIFLNDLDTKLKLKKADGEGAKDTKMTSSIVSARFVNKVSHVFRVDFLQKKKGISERKMYPIPIKFENKDSQITFS